jgi:transmembrane sensor
VPRSGAGLRPLEWARAAGAEAIVEREMRAGVRRRRQRRARALGAAVLAIALGGFVWRAREVAPGAAPAAAPAFVSAPTRQVLPDGSVIELNGGAGVIVEFTAGLRRVVLERGEAHFQVAKSPDRPFVVVARSVEVLAVGTAFSVQLEAARVEVLVTEGRVAVAPANFADETPPPVLVDAGHQVSVRTAPTATAVGAVATLGKADIAERLAWRVPRLELNFTPLSAILPVVNAHGDARLVLAEQSLGELKLTGSLRANNIPVLLQILESSFGIVAERPAPGEIVLRRGP